MGAAPHPITASMPRENVRCIGLLVDLGFVWWREIYCGWVPAIRLSPHWTHSRPRVLRPRACLTVKYPLHLGQRNVLMRKYAVNTTNMHPVNTVKGRMVASVVPRKMNHVSVETGRAERKAHTPILSQYRNGFSCSE